MATPKALTDIERLKNSLSLYHNIPPNKDIDAVITVDKRTTLGELKALLSAVIDALIPFVCSFFV